MKTNPNDAAFPRDVKNAPGLTKREYFAALATQGLVANPAFVPLFNNSHKRTGEDSVQISDALIEALNK